MTLVEKELTAQNVERANQSPELEKYIETEHKLTPTDPALLEQLFKAESYPVEQYYLSTPEDESSLRVRCSHKASGPEYSAAQKDHSQAKPGEALSRREIPTPISAEAFEYYKSMGLPGVQKRRANVMEGVTVDFYDDPDHPVIVEVEHTDPEIRSYLLAVMQDMTGNTLTDRSDDPRLTNEAIAFKHRPEVQPSPESLDILTQRLVAEMVAHYVSGKQQVVATLRGMSGSGKSTVVKAAQEQLVALFGESMRPITLSTDDYHFGKAHLEATYGAPYVDWDHAKTYNTEALAADLAALARGETIPARSFSFATEEPVYGELMQPSPFIIVEGLYAGSRELDDARDLHFDLPTSLATSIHRDLRRLTIDNRANRAFPTPESRLRHQLEVALPLYLEQETPKKNSFSACARPLGERAWMLARLSA